jgi:hypothetical protein
MSWFKKRSEPDSETIKKIYNRLSDIEHSQSLLEAKFNTIKLKLNSLSGKIYREERLAQDNPNRNEYIPQVIIPE